MIVILNLLAAGHGRTARRWQSGCGTIAGQCAGGTGPHGHARRWGSLSATAEHPRRGTQCTGADRNC